MASLLDNWIPALLTVVTSVGASSGFWAYFQKKDNQRNATIQLLLGLAHDRITFLGMKYIERGWITKDEYEDYIKYLYAPYSHFGGNGLAERVMNEVAKLPFRSVNPIVQIVEEKHVRDLSSDG